MKRLVASLLACILLVTGNTHIVEASSASASAEEPVKYYCYYDTIGTITALRPQEVQRHTDYPGVDFVSFRYLADMLCSEVTKKDGGVLDFDYFGKKGTLVVGDDFITFDGEKIPFSGGKCYGGTFNCYVPYDLIPKVFNVELSVGTAIDPVPMVYEEIYLSIGRDPVAESVPVRYYNYQPITSYTDRQLAFMEGLGAPINLHNIYGGGVTIDFSEADKRDQYLRPLTGIYQNPAYTIPMKQTILYSWGIDDRESLVRTLDTMMGNLPSDKADLAWDICRMVFLAQYGNAVKYLSYEETLKYGMFAAQKAQQNFSSWKDYQDHYLKRCSYFMGSGSGVTEARRQILNRYYANDAYRGAAWNTSLAKSATNPLQ